MTWFQMFRNVFGLLDGKEKKWYVIIFLIRLGNVFAELFSIGAILPYMYVVADPLRAGTFPILRSIYEWSGGGTGFVIWSTVAFIALYGCKCAYIVFSNYTTSRIMRTVKSKHSVELFNYYMKLPYEKFIAQNPNLLQRRVTILVGNMIASVLTNTVRITVQVLTGLGLIITMLVVTSSFVVIASTVLIALFTVIYYFVRKKVRRLAIEMNSLEANLHKSVLEDFRGFKEIRVYNREAETAETASELIYGLNRLGITRRLINSIPGQVLEWGAVCVLLTLLIGSCIMSGSLESGIAEFSLCAASIIKLRTILTETIAFSTSFHENSSYYEELMDDLEGIEKADLEFRAHQPVNFEKTIELKNIYFKYQGTDKYILEDYSTTLEAGKCYGLSGRSGAGKSTLVDIIMGLLKPQQGEILIDGKSLAGNEAGWRDNVGYVTQDVYLKDASILENVALGIPVDRIDREKVKEALISAQLYDFVMKLPEKEMTNAGENGVLLSGGQKQRIGIARAFYNDASVLVFDEAYNSLDSQTEKEILSYLKDIKGKYTTIIISHSEDTLNICDKILHICEKTEV